MNTENICKNCTYFVQHYAKIDNEFAEVYCGHCINLLNKEQIDLDEKLADAMTKYDTINKFILDK